MVGRIKFRLFSMISFLLRLHLILPIPTITIFHRFIFLFWFRPGICTLWIFCWLLQISSTYLNVSHTTRNSTTTKYIHYTLYIYCIRRLKYAYLTNDQEMIYRNDDQGSVSNYEFFISYHFSQSIFKLIFSAYDTDAQSCISFYHMKYLNYHKLYTFLDL